jgi:uncharacterized damage-inducible protein DinB
VTRWIGEIEQFPGALGRAVGHLVPAQLDTPYRPGGWSVRQVVHHLADSHMNSFVRFKWALTEECPTIRPYLQDRWAALPDAAVAPVEPSLRILEGLHERWVRLLRSLDAEALEREFLHPESGRVRLERVVGLYAWHGRHHLAQIMLLARRSGWDA